jgi:DNA-binding XRE family transcriptional regulator
MNVEVRATGLRAMRDKHRLTQRELAHRLGVTQNYIPALEAGTRNPGPKLRQQLMQLFQCDFEELFQVVMINPVDNHETLLKPVPESRAEAS